MNVEEIIKELKRVAMDKKAQNPVVLNLKGLSVVADYFMICHGNSEIQVQAISKAIRDHAFKLELEPKPMEGYDEARWVLIDVGDVIVHIFHREEREFYNLEKLWSDATHMEMDEA